MASPSKVITREQYNALPDNEKKNWVAYTPSSDPEMVKAMSLADAEKEAAKIIQPLHDKLAALPIEDLPAEKLKDAVNKFDPLLEAKKAIEKLVKTPPIGTLAKPVAEALNSIIEIIGSLFYLIFALSRGQELFLDGIHNTITEIKWDELDDAMREVKRKKEEMEKNKDSTEKNKKTLKDNKKLIKDQVDKKTQEEIDEVTKRVNEAYENLDIAGGICQIQRKIDESLYSTMTWMGMKSLLLSAFDTLGIDLTPLDQVTQKQAEEFEKKFPNPQKSIDKMNKVIDKMNKNTKYIPLEELEKIDENLANDVKKSREERDAKVNEYKEAYNKRQIAVEKAKEERLAAEKAREDSMKELEKWRAERNNSIMNNNNLYTGKKDNTKTNTVKTN